jgi:hypothetical protein
MFCDRYCRDNLPVVLMGLKYGVTLREEQAREILWSKREPVMRG